MNQIDLSSQIEGIVSTIVADINAKTSNQISTIIKAELQRQIADFDFNKLITKLASAKLTEKVAKLEFGSDEMSKYISDAMSAVIDSRIADVNFPEHSIPAASIKQDEIVILGEQVQGGIIANFSSTGIDDRASNCVLTLMDEAVVVENNLLTLDLTVQGNLDVKGSVVKTSPFYADLEQSVTAKVQEGLNDELFTGFSTLLFDKIRADGIDLTKITIQGNTVIEGNAIGHSITSSKLREVGVLASLEVDGEALITNTLHVTNRRVGINTNEPSAVLSVWDEEVEVNVSKLKQGHAIIGTPRAQSVTLSSNNKQNIILTPDGQTIISNLVIGDSRVGSAIVPPKVVSTKGHIVFNAAPNLGGPLGWVCLGGASWANFGIIE